MKNAKETLKLLSNSSLKAALYPAASLMRIEQAFVGQERSDAAFQAYSQVISLLPGLSGEYLRRAFYAQVFEGCGRDFTVSFGTVFSKQGVRVGERVYIGMHCTVGHVDLGDYVTIGSNVDILSGTAQHNFDDMEIPIQDQGGSYSTIKIGVNSWIGNGSVIMANIGDNCIVGAGSVVTKPLPEKVIAAGNPARIIRER